MGIKEMPNEQGILAAMQSGLGSNAGLYLFPAVGAEGMNGYQSKLDRNPSGLLMYHPAGAKALAPSQLITEFLTEVLEAILAAFLLSQTRLTGFGARVGFVTLVGIVAAMTTNVPYWNWYGFPGSYTAAYMFTQIVDYLLVGLVVSALLKPKT